MADVQIAVIDQQNTEIALAVPGIQGPAGISSYKTISDTSYTVIESDRSKIMLFTANSNIAVTVPSGLSSTFDMMLVQVGTGQITVSAGGGVTINAALSATKTAYQYAVATLIPIGTNAFILSGEVTA
jgi:hypothetical protein